MLLIWKRISILIAILEFYSIIMRNWL